MAMAATVAPVAPFMRTASSANTNATLCSRSGASFAGRSSMAVGGLPLLGLALSRPATAGVVCATKEGKEQDTQEKATQKAVESPTTDVDSVTRKFGLEAGLWKVRLFALFG